METFLRERQAALRDQLKRFRRTASTPQDRDSTREDDRASLTNHGEMEALVIDRITEQLRAVDSALLRLREGRYGRCDDCGQEIALARLRALPFTRRCRGCQDRVEAETIRDLTVKVRSGWHTG